MGGFIGQIYKNFRHFLPTPSKKVINNLLKFPKGERAKDEKNLKKFDSLYCIIPFYLHIFAS